MGAGHLSHWLVRGEKLRVDPEIVLETWDAVNDGTHNSNTDMTFWDGWFYLCHQTSPFHLGSRRSRLLLWRSRDGRAWEKVTEFKAERGEYRDPTFGQIDGKLFVYVLPNLTRMAEPVTTFYSWSEDGGVTWQPFNEVNTPGWLYWRPKTIDNKTWYVTGYWHEHGKAVLLKSSDGVQWEIVSQIWEGDHNDETDFEFLPDGRILATGRLEAGDGLLGDRDACTLLSVASPPYTQWSYARSYETRFDGPCLFQYNGRIYGIGRYQASFFPRLAEQGGMFSRKRTSLFAVDEKGMTRLTDLPSAGDTSYAGIVIQGDDLYASYYTSDVKWNPPWILGMFKPTAIKMARISLPAMERAALGKRGK
jgi:hypothetical protein